jgi:hypothetical protein
LQQRDGRPIIGLVGEIYVRSNRFSNLNVIGEVERMGGEVWMAPVYEWFLYRNVRRAMRSRLDRDYRLLATNFLKDWVMNSSLTLYCPKIFRLRPLHGRQVPTQRCSQKQQMLSKKAF